ncbi:alpha/beta hydrolase fold-domain-containing protein [Neocallimastix sp. 'constans']|jgi:acetyl esterase/lipase
MSTFKGKAFKFIFKNFIRPLTKNPSIASKNIKMTRNTPIKGYIIEEKETEKKSKYILIKKDNNVDAKKVIYYIHGGVYLYGLNNLYMAFSCLLCDLRDDIEVILLDYSLAPENVFPTQLNEAVDVWMELTKTFDPKDIIIGGDSAGGNLSLVLIEKLKNDYNVAPGAGIFFSPWTDMTCTSESFYKNYTKDIILGGSRPLTKEMVEQMKNSVSYSFMGDGDRNDPYISPVFADYSTFPKSIFFVGGDEMLLDDTLTVVKKIRENPNNDVELIVKEGMFHVYPILGSFSVMSTKHDSYFLPEGKEGIERVKQFVLDYFK